MGGKTWQQDEEELFWLELIPQSPEGLHPDQRKYSWREVAEVMHERLGSKGYRKYNHQLIYEHFYQNCKSNHPSPRAKVFVRDYMQARGNKPIERPKEPKTPKIKAPVKRRTTSDDAGPSKPKRARQDSEGVLEILRGSSPRPYDSPYGYPYFLAANRPDVAHAASQTFDFDGRTMDRYYPSYRRVPLPFSPLSGYVAQGQSAMGHPQHEPLPPMNTQDSASLSSHQAYSVLRDHDGPQENGSPASIGGFLSRPASLPPMILEPRVGTPGAVDTRPDGIRTPLPSINSLVSFPDAARPPRLAGLITPRNHGPMFEALLSAASASSAEPSPNSSSIFSRSESFTLSRSDSPATTIADDNGADDGTTKGKGTTHPTQTQEQHVDVE